MKNLIWYNGLAFLILFPAAAVALALLFILMKGHCNHTGFEILRILMPLILTAVIAFVCLMVRPKNKAVWTALAINLIAIIFFISVDRLNIMVQYDRWLERGLPAAFEKNRR